MAVLILFIAEEQKALEADAVFHKIVVLARAAANEEDQQLEATRNLLTAVGDVFLMVDGRADRLSGLLANLLRQSKGYADFGIVDPDGRLLAGSHPCGTGLDYNETTWFSACLHGSDLVMGQYHGEYINGEPVLYFALPALNSHRKIHLDESKTHRRHRQYLF